MRSEAAQLVDTYFDSWKAKDFVALRSILADDVKFVGPLGTADGADEYQAAMERLGEITTDIVIIKTFYEGDDAVTWFELHTTTAVLSPVANWTHVEDGKIAEVRVTFDPRPLTDQLR